MSPPETQAGTVIAAYGRRVSLRLDDGSDLSARIKGRKLQVVCGDRVRATPIANEADWLIEAVDARRNSLTRPNQRGKTEVLAANLDLLIAVCAPQPTPDWYIVDRYLCAAEHMQIDGAVVFNKVDTGKATAAVDEELSRYRGVGYPALACSARTGNKLAAVAALFGRGTAIIVGQSGVGKSSLINALTRSELRTAAISSARGEGRHTTVTAVMLPAADGGYVVDSPGVRDYAPVIDEAAAVAIGFREIREAAERCRFGNCRHRREPGCAVKAAVEDDKISARRYESYRRLLNLTEQQSHY